MKLYFLISVYFISLTLYSQNTAGLITDSTQNPIPYATISIKNTNKGCFSDVDGRFALEQTLNPDDTITISCIGFETKMVSGKDIELPLKVTLNQSNHSIKAVTIEAYKRKLIKVKDKKRAHCMTRLSKGMEIVSYITVPKGGTIDEVVFYCMRDNSTKSCGVRVYEVNYKGEPGQLLIHQNVVKEIPRFASQIKFDLKQYNISAPSKGLFVGIVFMHGSELLHPEAKSENPFIHFSSLNSNKRTFQKIYNGKFFKDSFRFSEKHKANNLQCSFSY